MATRISPEWHQAQIQAYASEYPHYQCYAEALRRVLENAARAAFPEALVQTRPKSFSSFAEKAARKAAKYTDPTRQFNDLCGGRVIVQTLSQVESVRHFVESHFRIVETEDIGRRLGDQEFGYRDRHYVVQLDPAKAHSIGFSTEEIDRIGERRTELQIRTWVQHAWADTLHDRTYKTTLRLSAEARRTSALLAALMEDGDRNFDRLVNELDGLMASYATYATKGELHEEAETLEVILKNESSPDHMPSLLVRLAHSRSALGEHSRVIELLRPFTSDAHAAREEIQLELGIALCRVHRHEPASAEYVEGRGWIRRVTERCASTESAAVRDLVRLRGLRARALSRLGWAWEIEDRHAVEARECYRQALEHEPANPYYLAETLAFELRIDPGSGLAATLRPVIKGAIHACEDHARSGLELPFAFFTAGRLRLLLGEQESALLEYLRGARYCLGGRGAFGCEVLDAEIAWLHRVNFGRQLPTPFQWVRDFLELARVAHACTQRLPSSTTELPVTGTPIAGPVLILVGGAASLVPAVLDRVREPLAALLREATGSVIAGGTQVGVPGLVGELAQRLGSSTPEGRSFRLLGYRPERLPDDAPKDLRYDRHVTVGSAQFSPEQLIAIWADILASEILPSEVRVLGIGGGPLSAVEYRMALALGASVGVVIGTAGEAEALLKDSFWNQADNLLPLPLDAATWRAFCVPPNEEAVCEPPVIEKMAREFHATYIASNPKKLPESLRPWEHLPETYRKANLEQARYVIEILRAAGFQVRKAKGTPDASIQFNADEIDRMAELEHGRWNVERLRDGWRPGPRNDAEKLHDCIDEWTVLSDGPDGVKRFDRGAVSAFPRILAHAGLEIVRT